MSELFKWEPPAWVPVTAWDCFVAMRKLKARGNKNPWTDLARDRAIDALADMHKRGVDIAEVLLICAEYGWVGVQWGERELVKRSPMLHSQRANLAPSRQAQALHDLERMKR